MANSDQPIGEVLRRYLEDAIAAEKNFETQLRAMAKQGDQVAPQQVFEEHANVTRSQHQRLEARLHELGGSSSTLKTLAAHFFNFAPKTAQIGHDEAEVSTQNLLIGYAVESSEIAMYEAMAVTARAAGDLQTEKLAREIQEEERDAAKKVWNLIDGSAQQAFQKVARAA